MNPGFDDSARGAWRTYLRLLRFSTRYWPLLLVAVLGMLIEAAAAGAFTWLMNPMVNETFVARSKEIRLALPLGIIVLFFVRGIGTFVTDYGMALTGRGVVRDLRHVLMRKLLRMPSAHFDREPVPNLVSHLNYDTEQLAHAGAESLKVLLTDSVTIAVLFWVMVQQSHRVTATMLVLVPLIAFISRFVSRRYRHINRGIQDGMASMAMAAEQALAAQQEVKIYGAQDDEADRFARLANRNRGLNVKVEVIRALASSTVQFLAAVALAAILYMAGREAIKGRMNAGEFVSLITAMMAMLPSLKRISNVQSAIQRGVAAAQRLFAIVDLPDETDTGTRALTRARGEIEFRDVSFRYPGHDVAALHAISFVARPGTVTAIVGRSGSGKSSLVRLIPRFYDPGAGEILLDGQPIATLHLADLRRQIALVSQRVMLFDASIAQNIAYGEQAGADEDAIRAAARDANALEFIERLPGGLTARIGENGSLLSGGQRQRLAIARAILKDAPILILDEATAALDGESEQLVQAALDRLMPERTTFVIAHRLATVEHADQVLVLDQGRLVERGTHAELIARDGLYAHLYRMQFRDSSDPLL